ncbi:RNA polymerase sigma factor sigB [Vicia villosa]|uniref:RNA polymerase sigma factor sigB n=1 Tax=Vicia villosa TaxID=3911 RepID=UPI00273B9554|nr:RNA polymerase sigma factor sigB [Vicia villosa]
MSCLLPHFNTFTTPIPIPTHRHHHIILQIKLRRNFYLRPHCILSPSAPSTALLEFDNHKFDAWPYVTSQENFKAASSAESLLTSEDAVITAAASEALALAKAAAKLAKDAALLVKDNPPQQQPVLRPQLPSTPENLLLKWVQHMEAQDAVAEGSVVTGPETTEEFDQEEPTIEELEDVEEELSNSIDARSGRLTERKARRVRASGKAATNIVSFKSGSTSRKKRVRTQEIDYSDPLRYLRSTTKSTKLLTSSEEVKLSAGIQDLITLEKLQKDLVEKYGGEPTFSQWATTAGVDQKTLRKRLNYGVHCKERMIKSNIRLVISVAKNYQGLGMSLQDVVQEGCRGLVRSTERYDASKGFKFSTYAHWWIRQAIRKALSLQSRVIRLPLHIVGAAYKVREAKKKLYSENGRQPTDQEVVEATGLSMKMLNAVYMVPKAPRSLDQKIGINQTLKPSDVLADPEAETAEEQLIKQFMKKDLEKVLDSLKPREKQVIRWRYGMDDGRMKSLQEIGEMMGVTRERVRQLESRAFRKLKNKKRAKHLQQYMNI